MPGRTKLTPEALRDRVLAAVPEWAGWPRRLRQLYALLPVYGTSSPALDEACAALHFDRANMQTILVANPSFGVRVREYASTGGYPRVPPSAPRSDGQHAASWRLSHREVTELLANEQTVIALVQLEAAGPDASPVLAKIVAGAGYYANIEAAAQERRARSQAEIVQRVADEARRKASKKASRISGRRGLFGRATALEAPPETTTAPATPENASQGLPDTADDGPEGDEADD